MYNKCAHGIWKDLRVKLFCTYFVDSRLFHLREENPLENPKTI
jgi:hypothetical protein